MIILAASPLNVFLHYLQCLFSPRFFGRVSPGGGTFARRYNNTCAARGARVMAATGHVSPTRAQGKHLPDYAAVTCIVAVVGL